MANISAPLRVLVVDDEPLIRWSLAETLTDEGHSVVEAGDAKAAFASVENTGAPFDVVLLDYRLPDSDDLGLLSRIRERTPDSAVIMMTAFGTPDMTGRALAMGAYCVVPKPFEVHDIATLVSQAHAAALARRQPR
jgi:DNA-binding NtrC family response regulator